MKMSFKIKYLIICCTCLVLIRCDLAGKESSEPPEPPELPKLEMYQLQVNFFTNQNIQKSVLEKTGYELASELVFTEMTPFVQNIHSYLLFLEPAHQSEPEFKDGIWKWRYTHTRENESFNVELTSEEINEGRHRWMLYISSSSSHNYRLMEFRTYPGDSGSFSIYPTEYQDPDILLNRWFILDFYFQDERYHQLNFGLAKSSPNFNFSGGDDFIVGEEISVRYTKDVAVHVLRMDSPSLTFQINWNGDTNVGSVSGTPVTQSTDQMICWDENLNDAECQN